MLVSGCSILVQLFIYIHGLSQGSQWVKNLSIMQETQGARVRSLGQEGLPEEGMATHSSILAGGIPRRSLVGYSPWGDRESDTADGTDHTRACVPIYSFKSQAVITCLIIGKVLNMAPCVYSRSLLSICSMYSSVCLFTPNSQFIPPSLPPFPFGKHVFVFCV